MNIFKRIKLLEENQLLLSEIIEKFIAESAKNSKPISDKRIFTDNVPAYQKEYVDERLKAKEYK